MSSASIVKIYTSCLSLYIFFWILGSRWPGALLALVYAINVAWKQSCEMSNVKCEFKILPQKRVIRHWYVFATKSVNPGQSKSLWDCFATFVVQLDIFIEFGLNVNVPGLKSPHWNIEFRIWAKCTGVWGKITPTKLAVFIKLYPTSEARMLHSKILPQTSKKFTQINLPYLWHFATLHSDILTGAID